ncbi:MAG: adenylyltransferase/cytidyltransferase family protein [Lachnospiraceae bacterium]|nr:adenylyltransferase/cytidyltransferase family protein [Lachnospiraceae bacterium]
MGKIVDKAIFREEIRPKLKKEGKTIALCHGVFDLVHPGHIIHLQQAKAMADILVASVTAAEYVRKGPGRPYFNDEMRLKVLEALEYTDYVMLSEGYTVDDIVENVEPDLYIKGEEYARESDDVTGKITAERELVEQHGGKVAYTTGQVFSSTKLINTALAALPDDVVKYMESFITKYSMTDIKKYAQKAEMLKVLVIGDVIIDKYTYCEVQGLMSKDTGYSSRLDYSEEYLGGAVAVARHLSSFTENVTLMSIVGNEEDIRLKFLDETADKMRLKLTYSTDFPTIIKHRYLTRNARREEYRKIFSVNNIPDPAVYEERAREEFFKGLAEKIDEFDVVFLCDFGHGLIDEKVRGFIQEKAKFLVLNCQTNSTNYGLNIITKYSRADVFTLDQKELKLAWPIETADENIALEKLSTHLGCSGWLTRGSDGAYGINDGQIHECPAFTLTVKDTVGAGDAFYSIAGLYAAVGAPTELGTFMGNIAGALGANIVGNKEAVEKVNVLKYAGTLLNI